MKLLVATITYEKEEYALGAFLDALKEQKEEFEILVVDNSPGNKYTKTLKEELKKKFPEKRATLLRADGEKRYDRIFASRKIVRDFFLKQEYTHILMLDSDVIIPPETIATFIKSKEEIATGIYINSFEENAKLALRPCLFIDVEGGARPVKIPEVLKNEKLEIGAAGLGCTFASRSVVEGSEFRLNRVGAGEDIYFYRDAIAAGFKPVALCSIKCAHLHFPPGDSRNHPFDMKKYRLEV